METQLAHVKLSDIAISDTNVMFRDESELELESLQELVDSVKEKGVIQPVLLRHSPNNGKSRTLFIRRFRAAKFVQTAFKDRDTIPAYIRQLTDEEAFELQVTENLQRKDVHPLKEAKAYKYLLDKDPQRNSVAELALRFGKSESYVLQRLKLNDLTEPAKIDFQKGLMSLGNALLLSRLMPDDQKEVIEHCSRTYTDDDKQKKKYYDTVHEMQQFIDEHIICNLSSVPFKKDDAALVPKAGACTACPKRSGASPLLFSDIKHTDRCFDRACFENKSLVHLANQVERLSEDQPDIALLQSWGKVSPYIQKVIAKNKLKVLESDKDFRTWGSGTKIKGMYINGSQAGHIVSVYSTKPKSKADKKTTDEKVDLKEAVSRIEDRRKRARELDDEKVYARVLEALDDVQLRKFKRSKTDEVMLAYMVYKEGPYDLDEAFKIKDKKPETLIESLSQMSLDEKIAMMRMVFLHKYSGQAPTVHTTHGKLILQAARDWGIPVDQFEEEQKEVRVKREARAMQRINELRQEMKPKKAKAKGNKS